MSRASGCKSPSPSSIPTRASIRASTRSRSSTSRVPTQGSRFPTRSWRMRSPSCSRRTRRFHGSFISRSTPASLDRQSTSTPRTHRLRAPDASQRGSRATATTKSSFPERRRHSARHRAERWKRHLRPGNARAQRRRGRDAHRQVDYLQLVRLLPAVQVRRQRPRDRLHNGDWPESHAALRLGARGNGVRKASVLLRCLAGQQDIRDPREHQRPTAPYSYGSPTVLLARPGKSPVTRTRRAKPCGCR